jgi:hypothetical protein
MRKVDSVVLPSSFSGLKKTNADPVTGKQNLIVQSPQSKQYLGFDAKINKGLQEITELINNMLEWDERITDVQGGIRTKKDVISKLKKVGDLATSLARSQPNEVEELEKRFQHILDQIDNEAVYNDTEDDYGEFTQHLNDECREELRPHFNRQIGVRRKDIAPEEDDAFEDAIEKCMDAKRQEYEDDSDRKHWGDIVNAFRKVIQNIQSLKTSQ